jgi:uncharacterized protein
MDSHSEPTLEANVGIRQCGTVGTVNEEPDARDFIAQWDGWHRAHEKQRARPLGFLAISGLHWLDVEPQRFDDVPGEWSGDDEGVRVSLGDDDELVVDDERISGDYNFGVVGEHGVRARFGDAVMEVARRDGHYMIRPRHRDHVTRTGYKGTPTYPPDINWVVQGTFIPYDPPRSVIVGASVEGLEHVYESPGEVDFEVARRHHRLIAFNDEAPDELFIVFTDMTAGIETYAACRFLSAAAPSAGGHVVLDFNRSTNPPCAYTDFATCPLPPPTNHLPLRVTAGEMAPLA